MSTRTPEARAVRQVPLSQRINGQPPARTLENAYRLCDPFTPLDPREDGALRADLDPIRGGDRLAHVVRNIHRAGGIPTLHFLSGHVGSGKTTELLRMRERLLQKIPDCTVLFLDADTMLDRYDTDLEDIVVALWSVVFRERPQAAAKVLVDLWKKQVAGALSGFVVNLPDKVPDAIDTVVGQLRLPGLEQRKKLRVAVGSVLTTLIDGLNKALHAIRDQGAGSIVVLIDNLEKLGQGQRDSVERLYLERMGALKDLDAHLVITVPLYLCYSAAGASLSALYGGEVVVLPMIKVRRRQKDGGSDDAEGLAAMADVLGRRVAFDALFEEGAAAATEIARLSGGCIRHALRLLQSAMSEHDAPPVTLASVERAAAAMQADFDRALPEAWVQHLHAVVEANQFAEACPEEIKRELLRHLFVLEYQNGEPEAWYAVHPLVERSRKFREHRPG